MSAPKEKILRKALGFSATWCEVTQRRTIHYSALRCDIPLHAFLVPFKVPIMHGHNAVHGHEPGNDVLPMIRLMTTPR